ncbi:MAG: virulence RhuM family protein [Defluviitaleaceae bacterium]|nr:virulence RhuM family protein [Defluviitaleaceae bacterium]
MSEIIIYQTEDGQTKIDVVMEDETVWLAQAHMAELFQTTKQNISLHINNAFKESELDPNSVVKEYLTTAADGKNYRVKYYNLDAIISVGYRVKSLRGTQFRRWALQVLREYLIKGFAMNDDLLKQAGGGSYWQELLARIRDIRSSEKMIYRQVLDLYATSIDYDPRTPESREFFKIVQNKIHYAAHGHTAAEVISQRANAELPNMGLTTFQGEQPTKGDIGVAKNYLTRDELDMLNRMVSAFFDLAELRAMQRQPMHMKDWTAELDDFAKRYGKGVLPGPGTVSHKAALAKAEVEYKKYRQQIIKELTPVERDYLASIKNAQKKLS